MEEGTSLYELGEDSEALEGSRGRVDRGEPCGAGHGATPFGGDETASSPTVVIPDADLLELAARLLPLRLRFLVTSVLRDRGRVTS